MIYTCLIINGFNLNSLNTASKSLDTFNQNKITLNDNISNDYKDDDPISCAERRRRSRIRQQTQQQHTTANRKLLLNKMAKTTAITKIVDLRKYLSNQKSLEMPADMIKHEQEPRNHQRNSNHLYHYLSTIKFNKKNNNNCNLNNNKLKAITAQRTTATNKENDDNDDADAEDEDDDEHDDDDAKQILHNSAAEKKLIPAGTKLEEQLLSFMMENKEAEDNFKQKYQTNYYVPPANTFSQNDYYWLGQVPQYQLQTQQLQLFLQQQTLRHSSSSAAAPAAPAATSLLSMAAAVAASLLPQEYHHLADYRLFFNAERHTQFYLHTLTAPNDFVTVATKQATATTTIQQPDGHNRYTNDYNYNYNDKGNTNSRESYKDDDDDDDDETQNKNKDNDDDDHKDNDDNDDMQMEIENKTNARVLNIITDAIAAAFGVNARPVAAIHGIQTEEIELYNGLSLRQSRFNPFNPCRILIHGWLGGSTAGMYNTLIPEYLKLQGGAYNIFTVDWGKGAMADYITASYRVKPVGIIVAQFIDFLHQHGGIPFENIHVIGFSMGAHVAGIAGKYVQAGRLPVIYGLDPALPLFRYEHVNERLDASDANYVEVVHTSVGSYGYDRPLGHVDFYINFGYNQPGCFFNECSHFRAFKVFAQSLTNEILMGEECLGELWRYMIKQRSCSMRIGRSLRMGVDGLKRNEMAQRKGVYYVLTNAQPPFKIN